MTDAVIMLGDGRELTEENFLAEISGSLRVKEMTISLGEKRKSPVSQYEPNDYHYSMKLDLEGITSLLSLVEDPATRKDLSSKAVQKIILKSESLSLFMKRLMHAEQAKDGVNPAGIVRRPEEVNEE